MEIDPRVIEALGLKGCLLYLAFLLCAGWGFLTVLDLFYGPGD